MKDLIHDKKQLESASGLKQNASQEDIDQATQNFSRLTEKKSKLEHKFHETLNSYDVRIRRLVMINKEFEKEKKVKEDETRLIKLKIKEFKRISQNKFMTSTKRSKKAGKSVSTRKSYFTPAKSSSKSKAADLRSNSSRRTLDDTFKYENETDTNYLDTKKTAQMPGNILKPAKIVKEVDEDDYGSDFDEYKEEPVPSQRHETNNVTQNQNHLRHLTETTSGINTSGVPQISPQNPLSYNTPQQSKVSAKPSFMIKRKF